MIKCLFMHLLFILLFVNVLIFGFRGEEGGQGGRDRDSADSKKFLPSSF